MLMPQQSAEEEAIFRAETSATKLAWHGKEVRKEKKKGERNPISVDESTLCISKASRMIDPQ